MVTAPRAHRPPHRPVLLRNMHPHQKRCLQSASSVSLLEYYGFLTPSFSPVILPFLLIFLSFICQRLRSSITGISPPWSLVRIYKRLQLADGGLRLVVTTSESLREIFCLLFNPYNLPHSICCGKWCHQTQRSSPNGTTIIAKVEATADTDRSVQ